MNIVVANTLLAKANDSHQADRDNYVIGMPSVARALTTSNQRIDAETETLLVAHSQRGEGFDASEDGSGRGTPLVPIAFDARQSDVLQYGNITGPLDTDGSSIAVAFDLQQITSKANRSRVGIDLPAPTMAKQSDMHIVTGYAVRRLTPMECERLQGFPDRYTDIEFRGKRAADGNRYKALGNSMATNAMRWLGDRIQLVESLAQHMEAA